MIPKNNRSSHGNIGRREKFHLNIIFKTGTYQNVTEKARDFFRPYMKNQKLISMLQLDSGQSTLFKYYLPQIESWFDLQNGTFDQTDTDFIPQIFSKITFADLKSLNLRNNKIESIDQLQNMEAPHLQILQLAQNAIVNIKTLKKAEWPSLQLLIVNQNFIIQFQSLQEANFLSLKSINAQNRFPQQIQVIQAVPKLKTQSKSLQVTFSNSDLSLKQLYFEETLMKRFVQNKEIWPIFNSIL